MLKNKIKIKVKMEGERGGAFVTIFTTICKERICTHSDWTISNFDKLPLKFMLFHTILMNLNKVYNDISIRGKYKEIGW